MSRSSLPFLFLLVAVLSTLAFTGCGPISIGEGTSSIAANSVEVSGYGIGVGELSLGNLSVAQSFTISSDVTVSSVALRLLRKGTFASNDTHTLTVTLEADSSNAPSGSALGTASIYVSQVTATASTSYGFSFTTPASLSAGTYWIRLTANYGASATNYVQWAGSDGQDYYSDGHAAYLNASNAWVTTLIGGLRDLTFSVQ